MAVDLALPLSIGVYDYLEPAIRFQKGVTGYLDYQDLLNRNLNGLAELLKPAEANLDLFLANVLEAAKFATATEIKVRENQRLAAIGQLPARTEYSGVAMVYNDWAVKAANRALSILKDTSKKLDDPNAPLAKLRDAHLQSELKATLEDTKEAFSLNLSEFNFGAEDFKESLGIWDEVANALSEGGVEKLFGYLGEQLETFIKLRQQAGRGTEPHSPLPWWKYVLIAAIIGVAVAAIVACFIWFGCTWAVAAAVGAAPWVFGIIDRGC